MKTQIDYFGCRENADWNERIEQVLQEFRAAKWIEQATVRVEQTRESAFPYRLSITLRMPGPDISAEGEGNTFDEAFLKVQKQVLVTYRHREEKRQRKDDAELGVKAGHRG